MPSTWSSWKPAVRRTTGRAHLAHQRGSRGFCREFGIAIAQGARLGVEQVARILADPNSAVPELIRGAMKLLVEEIRLLEVRTAQLERELTVIARASPACTTLLTIPGVGLLTATAMVAATSGSVQHFRDARHFASWFGLTPREHSSGNTRVLGRICYATLRDAQPYREPVRRPLEKIERTSFAIAA